VSSFCTVLSTLGNKDSISRRYISVTSNTPIPTQPLLRADHCHWWGGGFPLNTLTVVYYILLIPHREISCISL
jgi:hypothetical protein